MRALGRSVSLHIPAGAALSAVAFACLMLAPTAAFGADGSVLPAAGDRLAWLPVLIAIVVAALVVVVVAFILSARQRKKDSEDHPGAHQRKE